MSVKVNKDGNKVVLDFEVPNEEFKKAMDKAYEKNKQYFNVPGFRKGKVPKDVAIKYYGEGALFEEAFNIIADSEYTKAIEDNKLEVVSDPEVDIKEIGSDKDLVYSVTIYTKPEAKVSKYKGLEIEKVERELKDEDIEHELEVNREKNARIVTVTDRPLKEKDISVIDFEGFKDGEPFPGGKGENYELTIGSGQFIPGFEEQLVGMKIGDEKEIKVTFPEEYHAEELKGAEATFKVKLHEIKEKQLPELDDEFAKDVSEFETLEEYKADLKAKLEKEKADMAERETENRVIDALIENTEVEIPDPMVEHEVKHMMDDFAQRLQYQGFTLEQYAQMLGMDLNMLKEQFKPDAIKKIKVSLALEAVEKAEKIEITDEEVQERVKTLVGKDEDKMDEYMKNENIIEYVKSSLKSDKLVKLLVDSSKEK